MKCKIGLEIHVQLDTESKLFCGCPTTSKEPNGSCCEICLGMPGSKPMLNKKVVIYAISLARALNMKINEEMFFSRKTYFYPDLAKNFQITQYEVAVGINGRIAFGNKEIGIRRLHIEEDPASLVHPSGIQDSSYVLMDYNRSGIPLVEIVTEPEMQDADEARELLKKLRQILGYLGIFSSERCTIKADANISIEESGYSRVEIKNISGFKDIADAIDYEIMRQKKTFSEEGLIKKETRGYDPQKKITQALREKETEDDYGYIFDADLVPVMIYPDIESSLIKTEMPDAKVKRFMIDYHIEKDDAEVICQNRKISVFFEACASKTEPLLCARWIRRELMRVMNKLERENPPDDAGNFIIIMDAIASRKITERTAQRLIEKIYDDEDFSGLIEQNKSFDGGIEQFCSQALSQNPKVVEEYKTGKQEALNYLIGQVMRLSKGRADPKSIKEILISLI